MKFIVCAAIKMQDTGIVICGPRHGDCINTAIQVNVYNDENGNCICGFVDQDNNFYTREEAWVIADKMGEIRRPTGWEKDFSNAREPNVGDKRCLFSECLY